MKVLPAVTTIASSGNKCSSSSPLSSSIDGLDGRMDRESILSSTNSVSNSSNSSSSGNISISSSITIQSPLLLPYLETTNNCYSTVSSKPSLASISSSSFDNSITRATSTHHLTNQASTSSIWHSWRQEKNNENYSLMHAYHSQMNTSTNTVAATKPIGYERLNKKRLDLSSNYPNVACVVGDNTITYVLNSSYSNDSRMVSSIYEIIHK